MNSPITILLAEDNPGDVFLVRRALEKHGLQEVELVVVEDGQSALRYIESVDAEEDLVAPTLAMLDLNLPRATGTRILSKIRQSTRCGAIPIIIVTSSDSPMDRDAAAELGATAYFQKPGDLAGFMQLGKVVREALNGQASQSAGK
ncbi:MAG TPA: response regulator [Bryobacteraceae bacterium]|jgi:CheY-like chemotaxis protein|nr:response regulator [Bryobacteraceae bacterium]